MVDCQSKDCIPPELAKLGRLPARAKEQIQEEITGEPETDSHAGTMRPTLVTVPDPVETAHARREPREPFERPPRRPYAPVYKRSPTGGEEAWRDCS